MTMWLGLDTKALARSNVPPSSSRMTTMTDYALPLIARIENCVDYHPPPPVCLGEVYDGNGIYNCFQMDCDPTTSECPCETFARDTNPVSDGSRKVIYSACNSCE
jgi:hypothetical protein